MQNIFYRKADGQLYANKNGAEMSIHPKNLTAVSDENCRSSNLNFASKDDCGMYFLNLLKGNNVEAAAEFINNSTGYYKALAGIAEVMNPHTAVETLDGLGFAKVNSTVNGQSVVCYESREDWMNKLRSSGKVSNTGPLN